MRNTKPRRQCTGALCMQHSPTCSALNFVYPEPCPPTVPSWTHWLQDLGSHTAAYESWVKKIEEIKQLVEFRQCTNTAFQGKMQLLCSPFYQVVQKHKLYVKICSRVKVIASQRWDVFETRCRRLSPPITNIGQVLYNNCNSWKPLLKWYTKINC